MKGCTSFVRLYIRTRWVEDVSEGLVERHHLRTHSTVQVPASGQMSVAACERAQMLTSWNPSSIRILNTYPIK
jgi:hypothetical protein